jgi:hypothetical protein
MSIASAQDTKRARAPRQGQVGARQRGASGWGEYRGAAEAAAPPGARGMFAAYFPVVTGPAVCGGFGMLGHGPVVAAICGPMVDGELHFEHLMW